MKFCNDKPQMADEIHVFAEQYSHPTLPTQRQIKQTYLQIVGQFSNPNTTNCQQFVAVIHWNHNSSQNLKNFVSTARKNTCH